MIHLGWMSLSPSTERGIFLYRPGHWSLLLVFPRVSVFRRKRQPALTIDGSYSYDAERHFQVSHDHSITRTSSPESNDVVQAKALVESWADEVNAAGVSDSDWAIKGDRSW